MSTRFERIAYAAYWRCERVIAPGIDFHQLLHERALDRLIEQETRWLDIGCGRRSLPPWRAAKERELAARANRVVGVDPDFVSLTENRSLRCRIVGSGAHLPFPDGCFDLASANMVLEHIPEPEVVFREVARVLVPGGWFLFVTPNAAGYVARSAMLLPDRVKAALARVLEGRQGKDVFPTYYRANREPELRSLAKAAGFEVETLDHFSTTAALARLLPIAVLELLWIRLMEKPSLASLRSNLLGVLRVPPVSDDQNHQDDRPSQ